MSTKATLGNLTFVGSRLCDDRGRSLPSGTLHGKHVAKIMRATLPTLAIALAANLCTAGIAKSQSDTGGTTQGPLLQPGEPYPGTQQEPVQLRLPTHRATSEESATPTPHKQSRPEVANSSVSNGSPAGAISSSEAMQPAARTRLRQNTPARLANTAPTQNVPAPVPFSFDGSSPSPTAQPTESPPAKSAAPVARSASINAVTPAHAVAADTPKSSDRTNLTKRGAIMFDKGALAPRPVQYQALKVLATNLNSALESGATGIQLEAYGGAPGDKSSDARRMSLKRALSVRQLLIDDGVPSARIVVKAMGGVDDKGPADRVDVFIHAS